MGGFFNMDSKFFTFMTRVADLMLLNIVWILCCIPIVTIGAATTAMHYVTLKMVKNEEAYIVKSFFRSFKENFKQSTIIWLIMLALGIIFGADLAIMKYMTTGIISILKYFIFALLLIYLFVLIYVFPLQSKFVNTIKNTMKNALLMSIRHLPWTVLILIITFGPTLLMQFIPTLFTYGILVFFLVGFSLTAFINSFIFSKIFDQYVPEETDEEVVQKDEHFDRDGVFENIRYQGDIESSNEEGSSEEHSNEEHFNEEDSNE
ncbi:MAG TPA: DUF624 domain-containing protein [Candidatus Merdenecus merdavium]|nr:DUF624 domain-containing protein [Candidatus Merdenecus merdavium]